MILKSTHFFPISRVGGEGGGSNRDSTVHGNCLQVELTQITLIYITL